jgi:hypothetical protein
MQPVINDVAAIRNDLTTFQQEQPILLANSQAGNRELLYDPRLAGQWALLAAPNPTTRDDLMSFTGKLIYC